MDVDKIYKIIPKLPQIVRDKIRELCDGYTRTKDPRYIDIILETLEKFDDVPEIGELIKKMK